MELVASAFVNSSHIVVILCTFTESNIVKRRIYIFIVAVFISVWKRVRLAARRLLDVMKPGVVVAVKASDKVTRWANRPDVISIIEKIRVIRYLKKKIKKAIDLRI